VTITNIDVADFVLNEESSRIQTLTVAGAGTIKAGTILARDSSTGKLVVYVIGGSTNENGIPKCVLRHDVTADSAGDLPCAVLEKGVVNRKRLIVQADGDDSNITDAILDQLRDYGIAARSVRQLAELDNQ
jgi:hypothetical protein